jgi:hypothetical protein
MKKLLLIIFFITLTGCDNPPPSDESMIENFENNRAVFEELQKMICQDGYKTVSMDPEWSKPENLSAEAKEKYYALFKKIGVSQLQSYDGCRAQFSVWSVGLAGGGDYKNYQYRPKEPGNIMENLDTLQLNQTDIVTYNRKVDVDWYLSYEHWP